MNRQGFVHKKSAAHAPNIAGRILQRKCDCGSHTVGGGQCLECARHPNVPQSQKKMAIGRAGDALEREADRVADRLLTTGESDAQSVPSIQRWQTAASGNNDEQPVPDLVHDVLDSPGQALGADVRAFFGPRFGQDFSRVRIHTDAKAATSAQAVNALAYTAGHHIVFGTGKYSSAGEGRRVLAHELTHVVQQTGTSVHGGVVQRQQDAGLPGGIPAGPAPSTSVPAAAPPAPAAAPSAAAATPAKLHLFVDIDVKNLGFSDLAAGDVGHTWVALEYTDPAMVPATIHAAHKPQLLTPGKYADPMGFWPDASVGYSVNPLKSWVKGWMRHPDRAHQGAEKATETWDLNQAEVDNVISYAESKRTAQYSVYFYNCTSFAKGAVEASGKSAPGMSSWGFCMPNGAYDGIKKRQAKGVGTTSVTDFDTKKETVVSGPDATPKKR
jgi:Domain of unknown function (DUF4157)